MEDSETTSHVTYILWKKHRSLWDPHRETQGDQSLIMGHCQIPPEDDSERKPKKPYVKLQNLGAFFRRLRYIPGGPDNIPHRERSGYGKKKKKEGFLFPSPSCEAQPKLLCTAP